MRSTRTLVLKILYCRFFWLTAACRHAKPTITPLARGRNRCKRRRSGRRRTLRASVLHPTLPGRLRAPNPADNRTRKRASTGWDRARNKAPWSGRGSWATRTRENAAVERRRARAPRPWGARRHTRCLRAVKARHGAATFRTERLPALCPPFARGTKKEASPARFESRTTGRAGGALALSDEGSPDERSD